MTNLYYLLGLDKVAMLRRMVKHNGGVVMSLYKILRFDTLKEGQFMGTDQFGNRYYQNDSYFIGRNRWVEYADHVGFHFDASQVSPEWYGWLHYKTDLVPYEDKSRPHYPWMLKYTENLTGTEAQYMPYSTTKPKIEAWVPPKKK